MKKLSLVVVCVALSACVGGPGTGGNESSSNVVSSVAVSSSSTSSSSIASVSSAAVSSSSTLSSSKASVSSASVASSSSGSVVVAGCRDLTVEENPASFHYAQNCAGCHGGINANGTTQGAAFVPKGINPLASAFKNKDKTFAVPLNEFIKSQMKNFIGTCDDKDKCADAIAAHLLQKAGSNWCPDDVNSGPQPLPPVAYEILPGTTFEAPKTACSDLAPRADTKLTREQLKNAIGDIFAPITFPDLDSWLVDIPQEDNLASLSVLGLSAYLALFDKVGDYAASRLNQLNLGCNNNRACAEAFLVQRGKMAWGRLMSTDDMQKAMMSDLYDPYATEHPKAFTQLVSGLLLSSNFLYQFEQGQQINDGRIVLTGLDKAKKLSWLIWNSVPDAALVDAAVRGDLSKEAGFKQQVERMLADEKAERGFAQFHHEWLHLTGTVTPVVESGLLELTKMAKSAFANGETLEDLLTTPRAYVNGTLAKVYGLNAGPTAPAGDQCNTTNECKTIFGSSATDCKNAASNTSVCYCGNAPCGSVAGPSLDNATFTEVQLPDRPGILTRAALLAGTSTGSPSLSRRGEVIANSVLCAELPEPPPEVQDMFVTLPPLAGSTHRSRMETLAWTPGTECVGCHLKMDPYGFALENFGANGEWRDTQTENGPRLDVSVGASISPFGVAFTGPIELVEKIAANKASTAQCYAGKWFDYAFPNNKVLQEGEEPVAKIETCSEKELKARFVESNGDLVSLIRDLVNNPAFHYRKL